MPNNSESKAHNITTIYEELLELKNNNEIIDLTSENIYDNLNFDNYIKDMAIIHNAKTNILVGHGGQFCNSIIFGNDLICYSKPILIEHLNINHIHFEFNNFLNQLIQYSSNPSNFTKQKSAYVLSHNGLGDNITNIGAIIFLLQYYDTIYFLCKNHYEENVKLLFINKPVIIIPFNGSHELNECIRIINNVKDNAETDIFISGCHNTYLKSKITHPELLKYKQDDKGFTTEFSHIKYFYLDIGLDLSIYFNYFNIENSELSIKYYNEIKHYKIIFLHTKSSTNEINLDDIINLYKNNDEYIIICANKNMYNVSDAKYDLAAKYVNIYVAEYIDIIKNATIIHVIDSCFSCIVYPLKNTNRLNANECVIHTR